MAVEYGTIAVVPMGTWENSKDYDVGNLVELDGSSYVAKVKPPVGMLPTDTAYWQISAKGASKATVDIAGVVKPDGVTTEVDANASLSVKKATQSTIGIVKGSDDIKVGADGSIDVDTTFTQATELANIIAGEAIASVLGKVSKAIAITMSLDQNALLKNMLTSIDGNSSEKVPTQAYIHTLVERIGMGTELTAGANLTEVANELSSNLESIKDIGAAALLGTITATGAVNAISYNLNDYKRLDIQLYNMENKIIGCCTLLPQNISPQINAWINSYYDGATHCNVQFSVSTDSIYVISFSNSNVWTSCYIKVFGVK